MGEEDVLNEIANVYDEDVIQELIAEVTNWCCFKLLKSSLISI
jgi:hypothetical protein